MRMLITQLFFISSFHSVVFSAEDNLPQSTDPRVVIELFAEQLSAFLDEVVMAPTDGAVDRPGVSPDSSAVRTVDDHPRPGSRGCMVAFLHPKGAMGVLVELIEDPTRGQH
jgi:hypothetical protein